MKLCALLVHGIGVHDKNWAVSLIQKLEKRVLSKLAELAPSVKASAAGEIVDFRAFNWDDLFHERQMTLHGVLSVESKPKIIQNIQGFFNPITFIVNAAVDWFTKKIRPLQIKVVSQFIGDILAYRDPDAAMLVYAHLDNVLFKWNQDTSGKKAPLTFIAHSLGTVISSDYIYNQTKGGKRFNDHLIFENLFTIGSPIALFSLRYGDDPDAFSKPIQVESKEGLWLNIFDDDDPVGMPLKGLNEAHKKAVSQDIQVDAGLFGVSHTGYFDNAAVLDLIAHKLVIDWLRHNATLPPDKIANLLKEYDKKIEP